MHANVNAVDYRCQHLINKATFALHTIVISKCEPYHQVYAQKDKLLEDDVTVDSKFRHTRILDP